MVWSEETASFSGRWDQFTESWVYPKPKNGRVPIALGNAGPVGVRHAAEYADEWCPIDVGLLNDEGKPDVAAGIQQFRELATRSRPRRGGHPHQPVRLGVAHGTTASKNTPRRGVSQFVFTPANFDLPSADHTLRQLDELDSVIEAFG